MTLSHHAPIVTELERLDATFHSVWEGVDLTAETRRAYNAAYYQKHKSKHLAAQRARKQSDPEGTRAKQRVYNARRKAKSPEAVRAYHQDYNLKKSYGLSLADYDAAVEMQGGVCAICERGPSKHTKYHRLVVDHNHETGEVRGLLCDLCNKMLGHAHENPDVLRKAADYLCRN